MGKLRLRSRPRFEETVTCSRAQVVTRIREKLAASKDIGGLVLDTGRIELVPAHEEQHFWSPQLTVDVLEAPEGAVLKGRFGPHPHVWTLYLAIHAVGFMATLGAAVFGYSQHLAGQTPWALWILPAAPVLAALVWALSFVGQGVAAEQIYSLRRFLDDALEQETSAA